MKNFSYWRETLYVLRITYYFIFIINRTDKLIRIQHEKKHGKGSKNSSAYFDNKMIEEEEMEKQIDDGTFDECAYVKDDDDLCA